MENDWRIKVTRLVQSAEQRWGAGDDDGAAQDISSAFDLVDREGQQNDVCYVSVLVVAADMASAARDIEAGASLYRRAHDICVELGQDDAAATGGDDTSALLARATLGLARAEVSRGRADSARERYGLALQLLETFDGCPQELIDEARLGSQGTFD